MMRHGILLLLILVSPLWLPTDNASCGEPSPASKLSPVTVKAAIQKAIAPLQQGAAVSADERQCFTCHNQAIPIIALSCVAQLGFKIDQTNLQRQVQHTWNHLNRGKDRYEAGKGQGGQVMTAGYALWSLEVAHWHPDETTNAVAHYLVNYQKDKGRWLGNSSKRPPSSESGFTATYLALRALSYYGTETQNDDIAARRNAAAKWVLETEPRDTEDHVFRLRTLPYLDVEKSVIQTSVDALQAQQHPGGGWSQADGMPPDAYATGTVLAAFQELGHLRSDDEVVIRGCRYLVDTQLDDGTWHVVTRADPIQDYYESGFPHEEDQFISITATGWATVALALHFSTLPGN